MCIVPVRVREHGYPKENTVRGAFASLLALLASVSAVLLCIPIPAHAYVDPGTGSYLLQVSLAIVFATLFAVKHYLRRITGLLKRKRQKDAPSEPK